MIHPITSAKAIGMLLSPLENIVLEFSRIQRRIRSNDSKLPVRRQTGTEQVQASFNQLITEIYSIEERAAKPSSTQAPTSAIPLPPLDITPFSGSIEQWGEFFETFNSRIHCNSSLSSLQKLQYLRSLLQKEPLAVIKHVDVTAKNYDAAYSALVSHYSDHRRLLNYHVQKVFRFRSGSLKSFYETHLTAVNNIKSIEVPDLGDFLLMSIALNNLDPQTRSKFECTQKSDTIPTCNSLMEFVREQVRVQEISGDSPSTPRPNQAWSKSQKPTTYYPPPKQSQAFFITPKSRQGPSRRSSTSSSSSTRSTVFCPICEGDHRIYNCEEYFSLSGTRRLKLIRKLKRCTNCLGYKHSVDACPSHRRCSSCQQKHHSSLHRSDVSKNVEIKPRCSSPSSKAGYKVSHSENYNSHQKFSSALQQEKVKARKESHSSKNTYCQTDHAPLSHQVHDELSSSPPPSTIQNRSSFPTNSSRD